MGVLRSTLPAYPPGIPLLAAAGVLTAALLGVLMARDVQITMALVLSAAYAPLALLNLPLGLALWVAIVFVKHLPVTTFGENAAGLIVLTAWFGEVGFRSIRLPEQRRALAAVAVFVLWLALSITWADRADAGLDVVWQYGVAAVVFLVVATAPRTDRHVAVVCAGFVAGAVISVLAGVMETGLNSAQTAIESASDLEGGRLSAGGGDPNYLAAGLIPGIALAGGLMAVYRGPPARLALVLAIAACAVGLAASQSRGGLVAAVAAVLFSLVLARGHRLRVAGILLALVAVAATWFAANPAAFERITAMDDGGTGRSELWAVGWQIAGDHPVLGVGLGNYVEEAPAYVRATGSLEFGELIAERPHVVHNVYLQFLTETGLVGLLLFLVVVGLCLAITWRAARELQGLGMRSTEALARALLIAQLGMLAAAFFLSNGPDERLWILLALGPAMLAVARRAETTPP